MNYDYVIVGSGLFGSIFAYEMTKRSKKCLVLEKRAHIGGNCYTENIKGINIHKYGPHIFHTNNRQIWDYINQFTKFNNFICSPKANYKGNLYSLPFNLNTLYEIYGIKTPQEAKNFIKEAPNCDSLENYAISRLGNKMYEILVKDYTEKQWGKPCSELPSSILKRLPVRTTFNNNYFNDQYQGIPIGGYTQIFEKLLNGIEVKLNFDFLEAKNDFNNSKIVYTGSLDSLFGYDLGKLEYRGLRFEAQEVQTNDYQGCAVVNYTDKTPFTRICEHKHFEFGDNLPYSIITKEYPIKPANENERYYPIEIQENLTLYNQYKERVQSNYTLGGRLAEYKYYDMHQIIGSALNLVKKCKN